MPRQPRQKSTYEGEKTLTVTQVRSTIGNKPKAHGTLRALGLGTIGNTNVLPDRPEIRGMIARVPHLIKVVEGAGANAGSTATSNVDPTVDSTSEES